MLPLLADPALKPAAGRHRAAPPRPLDLLRIRFSSPLFRLGSAELIQERVGVPDRWARPDARRHRHDDRRHVVPTSTLTASGSSSCGTPPRGADCGRGRRRHAAAAPGPGRGSDEVVKQTTVGPDSVTVPARTVAVLEQPARAGSQAKACSEIDVKQAGESPLDGVGGKFVVGQLAGEVAVVCAHVEMAVTAQGGEEHLLLAGLGAPLRLLDARCHRVGGLGAGTMPSVRANWTPAAKHSVWFLATASIRPSS